VQKYNYIFVFVKVMPETLLLPFFRTPCSAAAVCLSVCLSPRKFILGVKVHFLRRILRVRVKVKVKVTTVKKHQNAGGRALA